MTVGDMTVFFLHCLEKEKKKSFSQHPMINDPQFSYLIKREKRS